MNACAEERTGLKSYSEGASGARSSEPNTKRSHMRRSSEPNTKRSHMRQHHNRSSRPLPSALNRGLPLPHLPHSSDGKTADKHTAPI